MLDLRLLRINRVAVHDVHTRGPNQTLVPPAYRETLVELPPGGVDMFNRRLAQALGHKSRSIKVAFRDVSAGSFFQRSAAMMNGNDQEFLETSKRVADMLAQAQLGRDYASSKLIVMSGTVTELQRPFSAVVKAEMQDALGEKEQDGERVIDYLQDIFLTESQRLFKIGFVQQVAARPVVDQGLYQPDSFSVHLFDHVMTGTESRSAAIYFYNDFLGADVSASDKRLTRDFYEKTNRFITASVNNAARRIELVESLRSDLRNNEHTIGVTSFSDRHLSPQETRDYTQFMERAGFPSHEITKDVEYISSRLRRRRKVVFTTGVMITTPAEQRGLIVVEPTNNGETVVRVQGAIESED